eukprot:jgi/Botrbrau1/8615/Bobra.0196s0013.2
MLDPSSFDQLNMSLDTVDTTHKGLEALTLSTAVHGSSQLDGSYTTDTAHKPNHNPQSSQRTAEEISHPDARVLLPEEGTVKRSTGDQAMQSPEALWNPSTENRGNHRLLRGGGSSYDMKAPQPESDGTSSSDEFRPQEGAVWDPAAALQAFVQESQLYGQWSSQWPGAPLAPQAIRGMQLPIRLAAQELQSLTSISGRVHEALAHGQRIYQTFAKKMERHLLKQALMAWVISRQNRADIADRLRCIRKKLQRGLLIRTVVGWLEAVEQQAVLSRKTDQFLRGRARACLHRCICEWLRLLDQRFWKQQLSLRDEQISLLESRTRRWTQHIVHFLHKRQRMRVFHAWTQATERSAVKRKLLLQADRKHHWNSRSSVFSAWRMWAQQHVHVRAFREGSISRCICTKMGRVWHAWKETHLRNVQQIQELTAAVSVRNSCLQAETWEAWRSYICIRSSIHVMAQKRQRTLTLHALQVWALQTSRSQNLYVHLAAFSSRWEFRCLQSTWQLWISSTQASKLKGLATEVERIEHKLWECQQDLERERQHSDKLLRVLASDQWARDAVVNLCHTGHFLHDDHVNLTSAIKDARELAQQWSSVVQLEHGRKDNAANIKPPKFFAGKANKHSCKSTIKAESHDDPQWLFF